MGTRFGPRDRVTEDILCNRQGWSKILGVIQKKSQMTSPDQNALGLTPRQVWSDGGVQAHRRTPSSGLASQLKNAS